MKLFALLALGILTVVTAQAMPRAEKIKNLGTYEALSDEEARALARVAITDPNIWAEIENGQRKLVAWRSSDTKGHLLRTVEAYKYDLGEGRASLTPVTGAQLCEKVVEMKNDKNEIQHEYQDYCWADENWN